MKDKQAKKISMYQKVLSTMDRHLAVWKQVPELSRTHDRFVRNFKKLSDLKEEAEKPLRPVRDQHEKKRADLMKLVVSTLGVIRLYAKDTKDTKLQKRTRFKAATLEKTSDRELLRLAGVIMEAGSGKGLKDYGITPEVVRVMDRAAADFSAAAGTLCKELKSRARCKEEIKKIMARNDKLLKTRMDRFMELFGEQNVKFYNDYQLARKCKAGKKADPGDALSGSSLASV
jgi:translation initiation factor 2 beta subunit (eIF-2beta)/eIF-5